MQVKPEPTGRAYASAKIAGVVSRLKPTHAINRVIRLREEWDDLGEAVGKGKRAETIRDLIQYFLRYPGAKMPPRPAPRDWEARHAERARERAGRDAAEGARPDG
jgi:hypothetical protein